MNNKKKTTSSKVFYINKIIFIILFIIGYFIINNIDPNNPFINGTTILLTILSLISLFFMDKQDLISEKYLKYFDKFINQLTFSSVFLIVGYNLALGRNDISELGYGVSYYVMFIMFIVLISALIVFISNQAEDKNKENEIKKGINEIKKHIYNGNSIPINDFLQIAIDKEANTLAVAGNLKGLNTEMGIKFLKKYLNKKKDGTSNRNNDGLNSTDNTLELFIPKSSEVLLKDLKKNFNDDELAKNILIRVVEPFVFIQGIVVAVSNIENNPIPTTIGYYMYKPILEEGDTLSQQGIFVDVSPDTKESSDYSKAIGAYYCHLKNVDYPVNDFKFISSILNQKDNRKHEYVGAPIKLNEVE